MTDEEMAALAATKRPQLLRREVGGTELRGQVIDHGGGFAGVGDGHTEQAWRVRTDTGELRPILASEWTVRP